MKRFFNDEPDDFFEDYVENMENMNDGEEGEGEEIYEEFTAYLDEQSLIDLIKQQVEEVIANDNENLLIMAITLAKEKIFWKFYNDDYQMSVIKKIYEGLKNIKNQSST